MTHGIRDVYDIALCLAEEIVEAAEREATELGIAASVAVVDRGGNLVAAARMDGSPVCAMPLAIDKAYTAAAVEAPTGAWTVTTQPGGEDWGFNSALGGRIIVLPGGEPLFHQGMIIGGVGISGGSGAQDQQCALAGARSIDIEAAT